MPTLKSAPLILRNHTMKKFLFYLLRQRVIFLLLTLLLLGSCHKEYDSTPDRRDYSDLQRNPNTP